MRINYQLKSCEAVSQDKSYTKPCNRSIPVTPLIGFFWSACFDKSQALPNLKLSGQSHYPLSVHNPQRTAMFSTLLQILTCRILAATRPHTHPLQALLLDSQTPSMATPMATPTVTTEKRVPGSNNATYCNIPSDEQLFESRLPHCLCTSTPTNSKQIPPPLTVITSDQIFFVYLRGIVPHLPGLADSRLRITSEAGLASGESQGPITYTVPLKTTTFGDIAHLAIRNETGAYGGGLSPGRNDLLADYWIPGAFLKTGWWTFHVEGILPDGRCLFRFQKREWLEGVGW